jgi:hypothetical protein
MPRNLMIAKSVLCDSDGSDDSSGGFHGIGGWTPSDRTLRKHVPKEIKQENYQRKEQESASPEKRAKSDSFAMEEFNFADDGSLEDFDGESPENYEARYQN